MTLGPGGIVAHPLTAITVKITKALRIQFMVAYPLLLGCIRPWMRLWSPYHTSGRIIQAMDSTLLDLRVIKVIRIYRKRLNIHCRLPDDHRPGSIPAIRIHQAAPPQLTRPNIPWDPTIGNAHIRRPKHSRSSSRLANKTVRKINPIFFMDDLLILHSKAMTGNNTILPVISKIRAR